MRLRAGWKPIELNKCEKPPRGQSDGMCAPSMLSGHFRRLSMSITVHPLSEQRVGLIFAALCAINGAFIPAVAKLTTNQGSALFVATMTSGFAALFGFFVLGIRGQSRILRDPATSLRLVATGTLGTGFAFLLFFIGAQRTSPIQSVLCLQIEPLYALLASWIFLGHRPTRRRVIAILALLTGIVCAVGDVICQDH